VKSLKIACQLALVFAFYCCLATTAHAQLGFPPFGTFQPGGFDAVNLQNLNVNFSIPIMSSRGRGIALNYSMTNNSNIWSPIGGTWYTTSVDSSGNPVFGWTVSGVTGGVTNSATATYSCGSPLYYSNFIYTDPSGTMHPFNIFYQGTNSCGYATSASGYATDGSGIFISSTGGTSTITLPSGGTVSGSTQVDINGNYISQVIVSSSETDWIDSVGRTALKVTKGSPNTTIQWLNPSGAYETTTVQYSSFNIKTNFAVTGIVEYSGTASLPTEIDLPNGNKYVFTYETTPGYSGYTTGRISQVTLPPGGYYQYSFNGPNDGVNPTSGAPTSLTRTINDGTNTTQWQYSSALSGSNWVTTVTAPQMPYDSVPNQSVFTFNSSAEETQEEYYKGSASGGTLLRTINTTWASNGTPATKITVLDSGQQSEVLTIYDNNGNLTQTNEYDWGSGAVGSLLRITQITYTSSAPFNVTQKLVMDGSANTKYLQNRAYDGASLTSVTGASNHDDAHYGSSYSTRGNLTSITTYSAPATPSGGITQNFTYNTLGNMLTSSLAGVQQKQYNYSSTTQYSRPDSIVSGPSGGPQLTTSYTYSAYTGQLTSTTDANSQTTSYTYDAYGRPTIVTRPDSTQLTTSYNDTSFIVTSTTPIDSSHSKKSVVAYDGLGRPITGSTEDSSSTLYSITATEYDPLGRAYKTSNPYTSSPSYWTTSEFDALGRSLATILPDGSQSTASYSGNVVTATDPSGRQRKSYSDGLGRLTEVDEPSATTTLAAGSGSGTISGTEGYHAATGATAGSGTVTISGTEGEVSVDNPTYDCSLYDCGGDCIEWRWNDHWTYYYDQGTVSITVNGHTDTVNYVSYSTSSNIATALKTAINADSSASVTATSSGSIVTLTAKTSGSSTNYGLSTASATTDTTGNFDIPSFYASSGDLLTGGAPATSSTYDTGTVSVTIDGNEVSASYSSSSTTSSIASALASAINSASPMPVSAIASGAGITLTASTAGASTNYSISSNSVSTQPTLFSSPSFSIPSFGPTLTGGVGPDLWTSSVSTTYTYDVLNDLIGVSQGSQTRTYTYDGLGRKTSASIPESTSSGTQHTSYSNYDSDSSCSTPNSFPGALVSTVDARGVRTCTQYDTLNRITATIYNVGSTGVTGTTSVGYSYGTSSSSYNNGRPLSMSDGTGTESYVYDALGHMTQLNKVINGTTYTVNYAYNLAHELTQITYPSGRVVAQTFDAVGRLCGIGASGSTCSSGTTYASQFSYNVAGQVTGFAFGNGVVANLAFSPDRLQIHCLQYDTTTLSNPCTKDSSALFMLTYQYGPAGANNGQISSVTDGMDNGRTASYTYDGLGRLSTAATVGSTAYPAWGLSWTYDRYGNRTAQSILSGCTGITCPTPSVSVTAGTNQITGSGYGFDADGNMTGDGLNTLNFDAMNASISSSGSLGSATYAYDGNGLRVRKCISNCTSPTSSTVYIFSGSRVIAEYDNGAAVTAPSREYVYSDGTLISKIAAGTTTYYQNDHLSTRLVTSSGGGVLEQLGHFPFGETWYDTGTEKWKFTTYERDAESGNDYAIARYNVNRLGRFASPDSIDGSPSDPQSWNHFSYSGNDPINRTDPTGRENALENCFDVHITFVNGYCPGGGGDCAPNCDSGGEPNGPGGNPGGWTGGTDVPTPNPSGQCVYLNNAGDGIESTDANSSANECRDSQGYFAPGQITGIDTNPNSDEVIVQYVNQQGGSSYLYQNGSQGPSEPLVGNIWQWAFQNTVTGAQISVVTWNIQMPRARTPKYTCNHPSDSNFGLAPWATSAIAGTLSNPLGIWVGFGWLMVTEGTGPCLDSLYK
jgi:RHS repeat-associated protein